MSGRRRFQKEEGSMQPPHILRDADMIHDLQFLPDKNRYPPRPGQQVAAPHCYQNNDGGFGFGGGFNDGNDDGLVRKNVYSVHESPQSCRYDATTYGWNNTFANDDRNYSKDNDGDDGDEFECDCCREFNYGYLGNVAAFLGVVGCLVAYMFCNLEIFMAIGTTGNWLNCLAYAFLGLPALTAITCVLCGFIGASQGNDQLLCFPNTFRDQVGYLPAIGVSGFILFFAIGIPLSMTVGQELAIQHYLDPSMSQDVDCYLRPQKKYEHGKVHFVFLNERDWEWNCSSTGTIQAADGRNYTVDKAAKKAKMDGGAHYFYVSNLFYTGVPQWNCPYPIFAACYGTKPNKTCEDLKSDKNCWKGPPIGISLRVMNQNEQFFKNWMNENDKDAEAFIREKIDRKMYAEPWRNHGPLVTYGGDHPLDFEEKLKSVRSGKKGVKICAYFFWALLIAIWCCDPKMRVVIVLFGCICCCKSPCK